MEEAERDQRVPPQSGEEEEGKRAGGARAFLALAWEWTRSVAVAVLLFLLVRTFVVEAFRIPTASMEGTLLAGDFLLVNKAVFGAEVPALGVHLPAFAEPAVGEVVVFTPPHDPGKSYVKRLVGVPGDILHMRDKVLFRNGKEIPEPYARHLDQGGDVVHPAMLWQGNHLLATPRRGYNPTRDNWGPLVVPPGHYFALGDNRDNSEDSRYWGFVPRSSIRGRPWIVYYSFEAAADQQLPWVKSIRWGRIGEAID